jgi:hypothetical protein
MMTGELLGTAEHAATISQGRHPGVQTALAWLAFAHLPEALQDYSRPFYQTAVELVTVVKTDSAELTTALNSLVEAKDWAVRAGVRAAQGKPGPVPRPATIVDPPLLPEAERRHQGPGFLGLPNHPDFGQEYHRPYPAGRLIVDRPQA